MDRLVLLPVLLPALIAAAALHELAHAVVARWLGDPTAQNEGRITLNPIKHLDPLGSAAFVVTFMLMPFAFGWAKPVPVQPRHFKSPKSGMAVVAVAGPIMNIILAWAALVFAGLFSAEAMPEYMVNVLQFFILINVILAVFNMFPIPPLDGSRIVGALLPDEAYRAWTKLDQFGFLFILILFVVVREPFFLLLQQGLDWALALLQWLPGTPGPGL